CPGVDLKLPADLSKDFMPLSVSRPARVVELAEKTLDGCMVLLKQLNSVHSKTHLGFRGILRLSVHAACQKGTATKKHKMHRERMCSKAFVLLVLFCGSCLGSGFALVIEGGHGVSTVVQLRLPVGAEPAGGGVHFRVWAP